MYFFAVVDDVVAFASNDVNTDEISFFAGIVVFVADVVGGDVALVVVVVIAIIRALVSASAIVAVVVV